MEINANDRTLGLVNIWQVLRKLKWELSLIDIIPDYTQIENMDKQVIATKDAICYAQINAASTCISLVDWLYHVVKNDENKKDLICSKYPTLNVSSDKELMVSLRTLNKDINSCHQICNANKHSHLRNLDKEFYVRTFDMIILNSNNENESISTRSIIEDQSEKNNSIDVKDMLKRVYSWWEMLLNDLNIDGKEVFFED
ncbi:hypothetical protein [Kangiella sp. TOML190]|uniref:hypothetical protein n=1 Tax=Kangiella sp. TOML190 TaxID=2931351 RepID=UPI0020404439|nr:hypothetical protein [Kangiella sp. TOML190]